MSETIKVIIFPKYSEGGGECVFIEMPEKDIMGLVEMLREGCTVQFTTRKTIGPRKGGWMTVKIVRSS